MYEVIVNYSLKYQGQSEKEAREVYNWFRNFYRETSGIVQLFKNKVEIK